MKSRFGRIGPRALVCLVGAVVLLAVAAGPALANIDLFVANPGINGPGYVAGVGAFAVGSAGGLTAFSGSPYNLTYGGYPGPSAISPNDSSLFVPDEVANVYPSAIGSGSLTIGAPVSTGANSDPEYTVLTPNGRRLYVLENNLAKLAGFAVGSGGKLTALPGSPYSVPSGTVPEAVAVTPNGKYLYTAGFAGSGNEIDAFSIASNGALSEVPGSPYSVGDYTNGLRLTPNGKFLYASNQDSTNPITIYAIQTNGTLTSVAAPANTFGGAGFPCAPAVVSPNGDDLYVDDGCGTSGILGYSISSTGTLTALPGSPYSAPAPGAGGTLWDIDMTPDGEHLYTLYDPSGSGDDSLSSWSVAGNRALSAQPGAVSTGGNGAFQNGVTISPDPGPVAADQATAAPAQAATKFSAAGSRATASIYSSLTYDWNFGDHNLAYNAGPTPTHVYAKPGTYTVTLTVIDGAGCSTAQSWTGTNWYCSPDPLASKSISVKVPPAVPTLTGLKQSHQSWREGTKAASISSHNHKPPVGTTFSFALNEAASVQLAFTTAGKPAGTLVLAGPAGSDKISFDGVLKGAKRLKPGTYTVSFTASNSAGKKSSTSKLTFTIVS